jgi:hypothetical protein
MKKVTDHQIRQHYGHNGLECRVTVSRLGDGRVMRHGSPDPTDRSKDFWTVIGSRVDAVREIESLNARRTA